MQEKLDEKEIFLKSKKVIESFTWKLFKLTMFVGLIISLLLSSLTMISDNSNDYIAFVIFFILMSITLLTFGVFISPILKIKYNKDYLIYIEGKDKYQDNLG